MTFSRRRSPRPLLFGPSAVVLVLAAAGCTAGGAQPAVTAPSPSGEAAAYCEALDRALPGTVAGLERSDPSPRSPLTAGWGDGAIVLRCGVPRPAKMEDAQSKAIDADGVNWLLEQRADDGPRFTSTYRKAYVEVTMDERFAHDASPLAEFAGAVRRTVPESL
ncbi:DUF3515 domain-containing protein [uncultured Streptomyces sp.]|uniref:DUF3515 domain-containing protein n=1 Tax=uncultured Streptomyces sp. TaxID=174707 RepID=UPI00260C45C8|nr:DUF3515 domain-containing protein [uncultured Streptomyces sp.]